MVIVKLTDGLGNQMFQYAYARYIQMEYGEKKLYFDISKLGGKHVRRYGLSHFKLNESVIIPNRLIQYTSRLYVKVLLNLLCRVFGISTKTEQGFRFFSKCGLYTNSAFFQYFPFYTTKLPVKFVRGFFQNEKYFEPIKNTIVNEFQLKDFSLDTRNGTLIQEILKTESVCVHIRRGDYLKSNKFNVCTEEYFKKGINYIKTKHPNAVFYVFSNTSEDVQWIRGNYSLGKDIKFVDFGNPEIIDFQLMKSCRHFVISNSTYSWWAAYLSDNKSKVVVAPKPWIKITEAYDGIYCQDWLVIKA